MTSAREPRWYESRFFQVTLVILGLVYVYVGQRLIGPSGLGTGARWAAWGLVVACIGLIPLSFWARWGPTRPDWGPRFRRFHYILLGLLFLLMCGMLLRDVGATLAWVTGVWPGGEAGRDLLRATNLAVVVAVGTAALIGFYQAKRTPALRRIDVPIAGLAASLDGLKVVQITDVHIGPTLKRSFVERVVDRVREADPDVVVITGDLVDGSVRELAADVAPLERVKAPLGVYFSPGNHDYYAGIEPWLKELRRLGVTCLTNAHHVIERGGGRLVLAGVTDPQGKMAGSAHIPDVRRAFEGAPDGVPRLLLAHRPRQMVDAVGHDVALQLSGHTHGGQMVPWNLLVKLAQPVVSGLHRTAEGWIYVSRGTGFWGPPMRLGVPSEITVLTLRAASKAS